MKDYIQQAVQTESLEDPLDGIYPEESHRLLHAGIGMVTEAGEFIDALKKHLYYDKDLDLTNLKEELGDILWYMAIAMDALDTDFDTEMRRNIDKLRVRYPNNFRVYDAEHRDLDAERMSLEAARSGD